MRAERCKQRHVGDKSGSGEYVHHEEGFHEVQNGTVLSSRTRNGNQTIRENDAPSHPEIARSVLLACLPLFNQELIDRDDLPVILALTGTNLLLRYSNAYFAS